MNFVLSSCGFAAICINLADFSGEATEAMGQGQPPLVTVARRQRGAKMYHKWALAARSPCYTTVCPGAKLPGILPGSAEPEFTPCRSRIKRTSVH